MIKALLVEDLISDGRALLRALDERAFLLESMFWLEIPEEEYWRLIIGKASPTGARESISELNKILSTLKLSSLRLSDVSILDPQSQQYRAFIREAHMSGKALFYRSTPDFVEGILGCCVSHDELKQVWSAERKSSNEIALIISLYENRVLLSFQPEYGGLAGIEHIKKTFSEALHRSRPDCDIQRLG